MGFLDKLFGGNKQSTPEAITVAEQKGGVYAPTSGRVEETALIPDPLFAGEAMGKTIAIWPEDSTVFAPISGTISSAMPHAFGIVGDDGIEILVHVGVDTVNMKGDGFNVLVGQNAHVRAGEPVLTFSRDKVAKAGYKDIIMIIITNTDDLANVEKVASGTVSAGHPIMEVTL